MKVVRKCSLLLSDDCYCEIRKSGTCAQLRRYTNQRGITHESWPNFCMFYVFFCFFFPSASVSFVPKFQEGERFNDSTQIYIKYTVYLFLRKKNLPFFRRTAAGWTSAVAYWIFEQLKSVRTKRKDTKAVHPASDNAFNIFIIPVIEPQLFFFYLLASKLTSNWRFHWAMSSFTVLYNSVKAPQ